MPASATRNWETLGKSLAVPPYLGLVMGLKRGDRSCHLLACVTHLFSYSWHPPPDISATITAILWMRKLRHRDASGWRPQSSLWRQASNHIITGVLTRHLGTQTHIFLFLVHICWNHLICQHATAFDLQKWQFRAVQPNKRHPIIKASVSRAGRIRAANSRNVLGQLVALRAVWVYGQWDQRNYGGCLRRTSWPWEKSIICREKEISWG